jgi:hypothetical protein
MLSCMYIQLCTVYVCIVPPSPSPVDRWRAWDGPATWSHAVVFVIYRPTYAQYTCTGGTGGRRGAGGGWEETWEETWRR